ncbi:MAG: hypothetical protein Fur0037_15530 [Planctomycetota bacterium]
MRSWALFLAPVSLALAACSDPDAPWRTPPLLLDLRARFEPDHVPLLGDTKLILDLFRRADLAVEFDPQVPAGFCGSVSSEPERPFGNGLWRRWVLDLRPLRGPGPVEVPEFVAKAADGTADARTGPLKLKVGSVLGSAGAELEPPAPPFGPATPWGVWAGAAAAALAGLWLLRRSRRRPVPPSEVSMPAHVKALRALERLRSAPRTTPQQIDAFYVEVSSVLRVYLEGRFGLRAPERTTEEFLAELDQPAVGSVLDDDQRRALRRFLSQCDLVKFAAQVPGEEVHEATFAIARDLVEATRPDAPRQRDSSLAEAG